MEIEFEKLKNQLKNRNFIIYGAGITGYLFIEYFCKKYNLIPKLVLDKKVEDASKFLGIPVLNPINYNPSKEEKKELIVIITVNKPEYVKEIKKFLKKKGFINVWVLSTKFIISHFKQFWSDISVFDKKFFTSDKKNLSKLKKDNKISDIKNTRTCILHIGWIKTGSTSIQFSLYKFKNKKFYYANLGKQGEFLPDHNRIMLSLLSNPWQYEWLGVSTKEELLKIRIDTLPGLIKSIKNARDRHLIISSEGLTLLSENRLNFLKKFLRLFYNQIIIYGYVREPFSLISSIFQQLLKSIFLTLDELEKYYFPYKKAFKKFFKIFGKRSVVLKKFDPSNFPDGCVVKDFCQTFGIPLSDTRIIRANVTLPKEIVSCMYILRKFYKLKMNEFHAYFLLHLFKKLFPAYNFTPFKISKKIIKPIIEKNKEDIKWMEKILGEKLVNFETLDISEEDYVIKSEKDLLNLPFEMIEKLKEYTNYKNNRKPLQVQVAEMLLLILAENFVDIKIQL